MYPSPNPNKLYYGLKASSMVLTKYSKSKTIFLREFVKNKSTGALCASSQKLARAMIKDVSLQNAKSIVEIGAGTGSFTQLILKEKPQNASFFAIEQSPLMAKELLNKFTNLDCEICNAKFLEQMLEKRGLSSVDLIISGIPWTMLKDKEQDELLALIYKSLKQGAYLSTFLYVLPTLPKNFMQILAKLKPQNLFMEISLLLLYIIVRSESLNKNFKIPYKPKFRIKV